MPTKEPELIHSRNQFSRTVFEFPVWLFGAIFLFLVPACIRSAPNEVVVYVALDKEFSEPILKDLEKELDLKILAKYDQESNKTVGLVNDILQSRDRPRGDLFWNNEILHTLRLQQEGLLESCSAKASENFPQQFVSSDKLWFGFASRARVLIVNKKLIPESTNYPRSVFDLADPKWKDKCAMARPMFGTTATHAAVLFESLGHEKGKELFASIASNAKIEGGNKTVAQKVARGEYAWGLTDTDDAIIEIEEGQPVVIVFPDQGADQMGTLFIPNTLAIIKSGPNTERARILLERLLQKDIETRLAAGPSAQIPLNKELENSSRVTKGHDSIKIMEIDFSAAAKNWNKVSETLRLIVP